MPKIKCQLRPTGYKIEWVKMVLGILNLEGHQNCINGSKETTTLPPFKKTKTKKTSNIGMCGVYPEAILSCTLIFFLGEHN